MTNSPLIEHQVHSIEPVPPDEVLEEIEGGAGIVAIFEIMRERIFTQLRANNSGESQDASKQFHTTWQKYFADMREKFFRGVDQSAFRLERRFACRTKKGQPVSVLCFSRSSERHISQEGHAQNDYNRCYVLFATNEQGEVVGFYWTSLRGSSSSSEIEITASLLCSRERFQGYGSILRNCYCIMMQDIADTCGKECTRIISDDNAARIAFEWHDPSLSDEDRELLKQEADCWQALFGDGRYDVLLGEQVFRPKEGF